MNLLLIKYEIAKRDMDRDLTIYATGRISKAMMPKVPFGAAAQNRAFAAKHGYGDPRRTTVKEALGIGGGSPVTQMGARRKAKKEAKMLMQAWSPYGGARPINRAAGR